MTSHKDEDKSVRQQIQQYLSEENLFTNALSLAEKKTGIPRMFLLSGAVAFFSMYLVVGYATSFLTSLLGFVYPFWASYKALDTNSKEDDTQWLIYWVVYSFFTILEYCSDFFLGWFPFYFLFKCVFLIWCMCPFPWNGASYLYRRVIFPFMKRYETQLGETFDTIKDEVGDLMGEAEKFVKETAIDAVVNQAKADNRKVSDHDDSPSKVASEEPSKQATPEPVVQEEEAISVLEEEVQHTEPDNMDMFDFDSSSSVEVVVPAVTAKEEPVILFQAASIDESEPMAPDGIDDHSESIETVQAPIEVDVVYNEPPPMDEDLFSFEDESDTPTPVHEEFVAAPIELSLAFSEPDHTQFDAEDIPSKYEQELIDPLTDEDEAEPEDITAAVNLDVTDKNENDDSVADDNDGRQDERHPTDSFHVEERMDVRYEFEEEHEFNTMVDAEKMGATVVIETMEETQTFVDEFDDFTADFTDDKHGSADVVEATDLLGAIDAAAMPTLVHSSSGSIVPENVPLSDEPLQSTASEELLDYY